MKRLSNKFLAFLLVLSSSAFVCAKDLYVATGGNDSLDYSQVAKEQPWASIEKGIYSLRAGDTLYIRGGSYGLEWPLIVRSDWHSKNYGGNPAIEMVAETGSEDNPVTVSGYPGEEVVVDLSRVEVFLRLEGKDHWHFSDLTFVNAQTVFDIGVDEAANHSRFENIVVRMNRGGDNLAAFRFISDRADYSHLSNCLIEGPGSGVHLNTAGIHARGLNHLVVERCSIRSVPIGIYFKHRNTASIDVEINIHSNFIEGTTRNSMQLNTVGADVRNNVLGLDNSDLLVNEANGVPGGDHNVFANNTFADSRLVLTAQTQDGDPIPGAIGNRMIDNVFAQPLLLHKGSSLNHGSELLANLVPAGDAIFSNNEAFTAEEWSTRMSVEGLISGYPEYTGSTLYLPVDFRLTISSPGYRAGSDGSDMGADTSRVGYSDDMSAPKAPLIL